jgi:hypothetical protein
VAFVDGWLHRHMPHVRRWQYDDNSGERSINLFHVHVFIETRPFSFTPREGCEYFPPHAVPSPDAVDTLVDTSAPQSVEREAVAATGCAVTTAVSI